MYEHKQCDVITLICHEVRVGTTEFNVTMELTYYNTQLEVFEHMCMM